MALGRIDKSIAARLNLIPFDFKAATNELSVAMANPMDLAAIEFLEKKTGLTDKAVCGDSRRK